MVERRSDQAREVERGVFVISVAAELAGVHPQTLRVYEQKKLIRPKRTSGNSRRYSQRDVERLRRIQTLTQEEGVNLAGVRKVMELESLLDRQSRELDAALERAARAESRLRDRHERRGVLVRLKDVRNIFGE